MGNMRWFLAFLLGMAAGGSLLLAYRVSQETGKPLPDALIAVTNEVKRAYASVGVRRPQYVPEMEPVVRPEAAVADRVRQT
jgi:hypothetical protein